jgi:hypothetical protein
MVVHMMLRPNEANLPGVDMPDIDTVCDVFTDNFLRAVSTQPHR